MESFGFNPQPHPLAEQDRDRRYEAAKSQWIEAHPEATHDEYTAAMTRIAREVGV